VRDSTVMGMHQANAKRNALILGQFEFLQSRQEAIEAVAKEATWLDRVKWLLAPSSFFEDVDKRQMEIINEGRKRLEEARAKAKAQPRILRI